MNKIVLFALFGLFAVSLAHNGHGRGHGGYKPSYFFSFTGNETINGVPPETRIKWMRFALETRLTKSPCPFDTFGAVIVNRTDDTLVCATFGTRSSTDPTGHAEISVIRK